MCSVSYNVDPSKTLRERRKPNGNHQKISCCLVLLQQGNSGGTVNARVVNRLTDEELQASVERLTQQRKGPGAITTSARDFNDWKRKHGVSPDTKVTRGGGYYVMREELHRDSDQKSHGYCFWEALGILVKNLTAFIQSDTGRHNL